MKSIVNQCTCGRQSKEKFESLQVVAGMAGLGILALGPPVAYMFVAGHPLVLLAVPAVVVAVTLAQYIIHYHGYVRAGHTQACAQRYALLRSSLIGLS